MTSEDSPPSLGAHEMIANGESGTQAFARRLIVAGYAALLVRSFARGASPADLNLVLWRWATPRRPGSSSSTTSAVSRDHLAGRLRRA